MAGLEWRIIHESDDDNGNPTSWAAEIDHPIHGKYCWITDEGDHFRVEVDHGSMETLAMCKTLTSAKRWVTQHLMQR